MASLWHSHIVLFLHVGVLVVICELLKHKHSHRATVNLTLLAD
jgi:hypothetical protein